RLGQDLYAIVFRIHTISNLQQKTPKNTIANLEYMSAQAGREFSVLRELRKQVSFGSSRSLHSTGESRIVMITQRTLVSRVREIGYLGIGLLNVTSQRRSISTTHQGVLNDWLDEESVVGDNSSVDSDDIDFQSGNMKDVSDSSSSDFDDIASEREEEQERSEQGRSSYNLLYLIMVSRRSGLQDRKRHWSLTVSVTVLAIVRILNYDCIDDFGYYPIMIPVLLFQQFHMTAKLWIALEDESIEPAANDAGLASTGELNESLTSKRSQKFRFHKLKFI
ncbi:hypothetical protein C0J52_25043, partial [Blattella germanica]